MIVRILGEGQFRLDDDSSAKLTVLDKDVDAAVHAGDEAVFKMALGAAVKLVRQAGVPVAIEAAKPNSDEIIKAMIAYFSRPIEAKASR